MTQIDKLNLRSFAIANHIGNRDKTWNGGDENGQNLREFDYTANSLNQYSQRTVPAIFDVLGVATATSTVIKGS